MLPNLSRKHFLIVSLSTVKTWRNVRIPGRHSESLLSNHITRPLMPGRNDGKRICSCHANSCFQYQVTDPHTQQISSGRWISYSTWCRHAKEEETWLKLQQIQDDSIQFETGLLAETLSQRHAEDSVVSSCSVQYQHNTNRAPGEYYPHKIRAINHGNLGQTLESEAHGVDVHMADTSQTDIKDNIDNSVRESGYHHYRFHAP